MAGQINIAGTSGSVQLFGNDTIVTDINIYFPPAGGLLFANGNALEATDGTFSGSVTTEGSISTGDNVTGSGTTQGIHLANNGNSYFTADGATQKSIAVYQTGNTTPNAYIQTDGSANFDGDVRGVDGSAWTLGTSGNANFAGIVTSQGNVLTLSSGNLDVGDRLKKADDALKALKASATAASDFASLKAAVVAALANI